MSCQCNHQDCNERQQPVSNGQTSVLGPLLTASPPREHPDEHSRGGAETQMQAQGSRKIRPLELQFPRKPTVPTAASAVIAAPIRL